MSHTLGQLLMTGVPGPVLNARTAAIFRRIQPGAFILFGRNIESPTQLRKLIDDLRETCAIEPIVTIDQEGGRVSRLKLIGHEPPNANQLRDRGDLALIERHGHITGRLLRMFGFNLDLCPVLDISFDDEADNSLKGRCYGNDVAQVIRNAGAFNHGLQSEGVLSCGKHFPGYSRAPIDAHHELPVIGLSRAELEAHELAVFRHFADKIDSMMIGHAFYPALDDSGVPSSLSRRVITDLLRGELGFRGLVITDDLEMGAILKNYGIGEACKMAVLAGVDMLAICADGEAVRTGYNAVLDAVNNGEIGLERINESLSRISKSKSYLSEPLTFDQNRLRELSKHISELNDRLSCNS